MVAIRRIFPRRRRSHASVKWRREGLTFHSDIKTAIRAGRWAAWCWRCPERVGTATHRQTPEQGARLGAFCAEQYQPGQEHPRAMAGGLPPRHTSAATAATVRPPTSMIWSATVDWACSYRLRKNASMRSGRVASAANRRRHNCSDSVSCTVRIVDSAGASWSKQVMHRRVLEHPRDDENLHLRLGGVGRDRTKVRVHHGHRDVIDSPGLVRPQRVDIDPLHENRVDLQPVTDLLRAPHHTPTPVLPGRPWRRPAQGTSGPVIGRPSASVTSPASLCST